MFTVGHIASVWRGPSKQQRQASKKWIKSSMLWVLEQEDGLSLWMEYWCWKIGAKTKVWKGPYIYLKKLLKVVALSLVKVSSLYY